MKISHCAPLAKASFRKSRGEKWLPRDCFRFGLPVFSPAMDRRDIRIPCKGSHWFHPQTRESRVANTSQIFFRRVDIRLVCKTGFLAFFGSAASP